MYLLDGVEDDIDFLVESIVSKKLIFSLFNKFEHI